MLGRLILKMLYLMCKYISLQMILRKALGWNS